MSQDAEKKDSIKIFIIWIAGAALLFGLWELQKLVPGSTGDVLANIIQIAAWFYPFALIPITVLVKKD